MSETELDEIEERLSRVLPGEDEGWDGYEGERAIDFVRDHAAALIAEVRHLRSRVAEVSP